MHKIKRKDLIASLDTKAPLIPGALGIFQAEDDIKVMVMDLDDNDVLLYIEESSFGVNVLAFIPEIEVPEYGRVEFASFLMELNSNLLRGSYCMMESYVAFKHFITIGDDEKMVEGHFLNELLLPYRMMKIHSTDIIQKIDSFTCDRVDKDEYRIITGCE